MTSSQMILIVLTIVPLGLIATNRLRVDVGALIIAGSLGIAQALGLGILGPPNTPADAVKAISGLGQPVVFTLFGLFVLSRGLEKTGVARWIARRMVAIGGKSETRLIILFTTTSALLSLFMNNLAAGALLLPSAMEAARRSGLRPSKLLIPVAYGSLLGGSATYFTTANIIASNLLTAAHPPQAALHILDFTGAGGLVALAGIAYLALFGRRLLPNREPSPEQTVARRTGSELEDAYFLGERLWEVRIMPGSPLDNQTLNNTDLGGRLGLAVAAIWRGRQAIFAPAPEQRLRAGDVLLTVGREERVTQLANLGAQIERDSANGHISPRGVSLIEVVLAPHSSAEGKTLRELDFRRNFGFTAVALLRDGRSYRTDVGQFALAPGDALLMVGAQQRLQSLGRNPDFIVLEADPSDLPVWRKQAALMGIVFVAATAASILGAPVYLMVLAGALIAVLAGILSMEEVYRSMEWRALFLIAGMYSVSIAMVQTGLAQLIGDRMVEIITPLGPVGLAAGAFLLTAALTQVMGGQVSALVTVPIAISAALSLHTSPQAMAVAAAIGCSASFFTPIAHPVNILMIGPGNYRFSDFFRVGWRLTIVCFAALIVGMVVFWRL